MPFNDDEISDASGSPLELYKFVGTFNTWRLTSFATDVTNTDGTYTAVPISRSNIENVGQDHSDMALDITLPHDHPLVFEYVYDISPPELTLEIMRAHRSNVNDTYRLWIGKPISFSIEGRWAKLRVPSSLSHLLSGLMPPPRYQAPCNHVLYDDRCKVDRAANSETVTVTGVNPKRRQLTVDALTLGDGECVAGEMVWDAGGQRRMITNNIGNVVYINYPFSGDVVGATMIVRRGCDHSFTECKLKFDNAFNFGGFPLVPNVNPFKKQRL